MIRHFIDLWDITVEEGWLILDESLRIKEGTNQEKILEGKYFALIFTKPSTRTRVSFEVGIRKLGGEVMFLQESNLQLVRGEDLKDTARTLSRYLDGVVVRTDSHEKLKEFASYSSSSGDKRPDGYVPPLSGFE
jgi:ornithine carbamoyltransferase